MDLSLYPLSPQDWREFFKKKPKASIEQPLEEIIQQYFHPELIFSTGKYFLFVFDMLPTVNLVHVQGDFEQMTNYTPKDVLYRDLPKLHDLLVSPEESPLLLRLSQLASMYLDNLPINKKGKIKLSFYYNLLRKDGTSFPVIQQDTYFYDKDSIIVYVFSFVTDISHIKSRNEVMMSILDVENESQQIFTCIKIDEQTKIHDTASILSLRERQILGLLANGLGSKQIADRLHIAFNTVNVHRQNMLAKTACKSSSELVKFALDKGLI